MTARGRKPKPARLKVLEGNPGKRKINPGLQLPPGAPPEPQWPALLPGTREKRQREEAQREWRRVVPDLDRMGLLAHVDRGLLADYCVCWARLVECERLISETGLVTATTVVVRANGEEVVQLGRNPLSVTAKEYRSQLKHYCSELGLGPSSRGRLNVPGRDEVDDGEQAVFSN